MSALQTEFYVPDRPGAPATIERACAIAASHPRGETVAVAVDASNVSRAASLLFGTGIGVVGALGDQPADSVVNQARISVATGASEIAVHSIRLDQQAVLRDLKTFLGSTTPLTVDVTFDHRVDLDAAEHALVLGADFVSFSPTEQSVGVDSQIANLLALAGELRLGGVKVGALTDDHSTAHRLALRENEWAAEPGRSRLRLPVL